MNRKRFLGALAAGAGAVVARGSVPAWASDALGAVPPTPQSARNPLRIPVVESADRLTLVAAPTTVNIGPTTARAWAINGGVPGPTLRLRRGRTTRIRLENALPEETILHWHGLDVPEAADGHPRLAIPPGASYDYELPVVDRAGTYWYHPHTHMRTAPQTYRGMAGLLIVEDDEEAALALPSGGREIPLILQDKRSAGAASLEYAPGMGPDHMLGYLGDTPFGNGVAHPTLEVDRALHRLRILNASNARIFDLALDDEPLTVIGADGGLLEAPVRVDRLMLATGERIDVVVDLSGRRPGDRILLRSLPFEVPGMMMGPMMGGGRGMGRGMGRGGMGMGSAVPQGAPFDLLELVVRDGPAEGARPLPERLTSIPRPAVAGDTPRRTFRFVSAMMSHTINGRAFDMERIDERVPMGRTEVWSFVNESMLPHPVHVHCGQLHVLARNGGRARVMPWETGLKDTVLVLPNERVDVAVRFDRHPGVFLLHCHNLEHEDMGMMLNFEVVG